jgi:hypothetical protein
MSFWRALRLFWREDKEHLVVLEEMRGELMYFNFGDCAASFRPQITLPFRRVLFDWWAAQVRKNISI